MGKVLRWMGLTVSVVRGDSEKHGRRALFEADVVYTTASTLCFTYLFDNTANEEGVIVSIAAYKLW